MSTSRRPVIIVDDVIEDRSHRPPTNNSSAPPHVKRYSRGRYLGKGGFAKVYAFTSLDSGREYACKIIPKASLVKDSSRKKLMNEINIHRTIRHPQVVRFERFFEDKNNIYILLELCPNQTMLELVKKRGCLSEVECQFYILQLVLTIQHLHASSIIHRDLKLGNLFLGDGLELKVGDFGLATRLDFIDERKRTICGTPNYIAPEILDNSNGHSFEVDVWAIGVIMYTLLYGAPPFETQSVKTTYTRIRDNIYSFPSPSDANYRPVTPAAKSLIRRILCTDPKARPTLTEMRNDSFFLQSAVPERLGMSVLDKEFPRQHECWKAIKEQEVKDREEERRRRQEEEERQERDNDQENTLIKDSDSTLIANPTKADAVLPPPQHPASTPRVVLGEKAMNALKEAVAAGDVAPLAVERRAVMAKVVTPPVVRPSSPQPKLPKRKETLEKEREEIITRLKARTAASPPATSTAHFTASPPHSTATSSPGGPHPFLHPINGTGAGPAKETTPVVVPSPSTIRRVLPSSLIISPSIRRTLSAAPVLSTVTGSVTVPSPPSISTAVTTVITTVATSSTSSLIRPSSSLRPSPSMSTPARSKSVSPVQSPFNARTPLPGRSTPSSFPSAHSSSPSGLTHPLPSHPLPPPSAPLSDSPLTWSTSPSRVVSIASVDPTSSSALPSPCSSPPPLGAEREVDELRRGREERELRAELEEKIDQERKRIREEGGSENSGRVTRGQVKRKEEEKEVDTITTAVQSITLSAIVAPTVTSSLTRRAALSPPAASLPPPLPSVIEESFIAAGAGDDGSFTPSLYVDKWVDYSAKYGLGYLLSDGRVGVYFNDASKAIMHGPSSTAIGFTYVERRSREEGGGEQVDHYDLHDHPPALHKKVTLLKHYANYITSRSSSTASTTCAPHPSSSSSSSPSLPFVRKWLRTKHAIFFRLSCGAVQVIFNDRTELVVSDGCVVYTDRGGRRVGGPLEELETKNEPGLAKRLRYQREILQHMNSKTQRTGAAHDKQDVREGRGEEDRKGRGRSKRA